MECSPVILVPITTDSEPCRIFTAAGESVGGNWWFGLVFSYLWRIAFWIINLRFRCCMFGPQSQRELRNFCRLQRLFNQRILSKFHMETEMSRIQQIRGGVWRGGVETGRGSQGFSPEVGKGVAEGEWGSFKEWGLWSCAGAASRKIRTQKDKLWRTPPLGSWTRGSGTLSPTKTSWAPSLK